jgi:hypothetical protein
MMVMVIDQKYFKYKYKYTEKTAGWCFDIEHNNAFRCADMMNVHTYFCPGPIRFKVLAFVCMRIYSALSIGGVASYLLLLQKLL